MKNKLILIKCRECGFEKSYKKLALPAGDLSYWTCPHCGYKAGNNGLIPTKTLISDKICSVCGETATKEIQIIFNNIEKFDPRCDDHAIYDGGVRTL